MKQNCERNVKDPAILDYNAGIENLVLSLNKTENIKINNFPKETMKPVIVSGHHLLLTEAIKSLSTEKFQKLFRHYPSIVRARVELQEEKDHKSETKLLFTAKGHLEVEGPDLIATAASSDLYKSIDLLVRKLDEQIRRRHGAQRAKRKDALAA